MKLYQIFIFVGVFMVTTSLITSWSRGQDVDVTQNFDLPLDLKDCKIYRVLSKDGATAIHLSRCKTAAREVSLANLLKE
jgi:hypothetical protein